MSTISLDAFRGIKSDTSILEDQNVYVTNEQKTEIGAGKEFQFSADGKTRTVMTPAKMDLEVAQDSIYLRSQLLTAVREALCGTNREVLQQIEAKLFGAKSKDGTFDAEKASTPLTKREITEIVDLTDAVSANLPKTTKVNFSWLKAIADNASIKDSAEVYDPNGEGPAGLRRQVRDEVLKLLGGESGLDGNNDKKRAFAEVERILLGTVMEKGVEVDKSTIPLTKRDVREVVRWAESVGVSNVFTLNASEENVAVGLQQMKELRTLASAESHAEARFLELGDVRTGSLFDALGAQTFGLAGADSKREVAAQVNGSRLHAEALRAEVRRSVDSVLDRSKDKFVVEVYGDEGQQKEIADKMAVLEDLVDRKFGITGNEALQVAQADNIVLGVELVVDKLKGMDAAEFLACDLNALLKFDDPAKAKALLDKLTEKARTGRAVAQYETEKLTTGFFAACANKTKLEEKKLQRFFDAINNPEYCKAQDRKDFHITTCPIVAVDRKDPYAHAATGVEFEVMEGGTSNIVDAIARDAEKTGARQITFVHVYSDQKMFLGYSKTTTGSQEETLCRCLNPAPFAAMRNQNLFVDNGNASCYDYTCQQNGEGLPNADVITGTIFDGEFDFAGTRLLEKPNKARIMLAAEQSYAKIPGNFDRKGQLVNMVKFLREVQGETVGPQQIVNANRVINCFFDRAASKSRLGLPVQQYKKAIEILTFYKNSDFNPLAEKALTDKQVNALVDKAIEMAKNPDHPSQTIARENHVKNLHHVYAGRMKAMCDEVLAERKRTGDPTVMGVYVGGQAGCGAFENDPELIADVEAYEFLMNCGGLVKYVYPQFKHGDEVQRNPELGDEALIWQGAMARNLEKIKADKAAYTAMSTRANMLKIIDELAVKKVIEPLDEAALGMDGGYGDRKSALDDQAYKQPMRDALTLSHITTAPESFVFALNFASRTLEAFQQVPVDVKRHYQAFLKEAQTTVAGAVTRGSGGLPASPVAIRGELMKLLEKNFSRDKWDEVLEDEIASVLDAVVEHVKARGAKK